MNVHMKRITDVKITNRIRNLFIIAAPALFILVLLRFFHFRYITNDDTTMISILSGSYTGDPDGHAVFIHYPLSLIIAFLYKCTPQISWYMVFFLCVYWLCMSLSLRSLSVRFRNHECVFAALYFLLVGSFWGRAVSRFTFTTCAAFVSASAVLCYALLPAEDDHNFKKMLPVYTMFFISFCIRRQYLYSGLLLLGILWLYKHLDTMWKDRRAWVVPLAAVCLIAAAKLCHMAAYADPQWKTYQKYDDIRSEVFDYQMFADYLNDKEFYEYIGIDSKKLMPLLNYRYGISQQDPMEVIVRIYDYAKAHPKRAKIRPGEIVSGIRESLFAPGQNETAQMQIVLLLSAALFVILLIPGWKRTSRKDRLLFVLLLAANMALWVGIHMRGRVNERALESLFVYSILSFWICIGILAGRGRFRPAAGLETVMAGGAVIVLGLALVAQHEMLDNNLIRTHTPYNAYASMHPDDIFIRDTFGYGPDAAEDTMVNCIGTGGWDFYSPIYWKKMETLGIPEGITRDTLLKDNVYLITRPEFNLREVLGLHKEETLRYRIEFEAMDVRVYKIEELPAS